MVRTQIYLTEDEQSNLKGLSAQTGKPQSELIREAIDLYIVRYIPDSRNKILQKAKGIWKGRNDLELENIRKEFDRF